MKNKFLILSFIFLATAKIGAAQDQGDVLVHPSTPHLLPSHDLSNGATKGSIELSTTTTDPYELDEISDAFFSKRQFKESAKTFVLAAIHGSRDSLASLYDIDSQSLKYLSSQNPQSPEALLYYETTLFPMVIEYLKLQSIKLKEAENKPIKFRMAGETDVYTVTYHEKK